MRVIVDTNVLVSAIIRDNLPEQVIMFIISQPTVEWIATTEIIEEYKAVLQRNKFKLPNAIIQRWFDLLDEEIILVSSQLNIDFKRDIKDAKFLACAVEGQADVLITGDSDFNDALDLVKTQIMSVTQFKSFMESCEF